MNILKNFKSIDFLGAKFEMNIKGKPRYTTILGSFLSICCSFVLILGLYVFGNNLYDKSSPEVTINSQILKEYPYMNLYDNSIVPGFGLYNGTHFVSNQKLGSYMTVLAIVITIDYDKVNSKIPNLKTEIIKFIPCTSVKEGLLDVMVKKDAKSKKFMEAYGLCPDIKSSKDWYVQGMLSNPPFHYIQIHALPCVESPLQKC